MEALERALATNATLTRVDLAENSLPDEVPPIRASFACFAFAVFAFAFFAVTQQYNKTKTRARQQWLAQSGVMIIGALSSFIATILYVAAHNGTWALHLVPDQPPEI